MKKALEMFKPLSGDGLIHLSAKGLRVQLTDTSGTMFLDMVADASSFINYVCEEDKVICVNLADIYECMSRPQEDDVLLMFIPKDGNEVRFHIMKREGSKVLRDRMFCVPMMTAGELKIKDFDFKHTNALKISSKLFKTAVGDMVSTSDKLTGSISIELSEKKVKFFTGSKGGVKTKVEYHKSELGGIEIKGTETLTVLLGMKLLHNMFSKMNDDLMLKFYYPDEANKGRPTRCDFDIVDLKLNVLSSSSPFKFSLLLAPIISSSDEVTDIADDDDEGLEVGEDFKIPELDIAKENIVKEEVKK